MAKQKIPSYFLPIRRSALDGKSVRWTTLQRVENNSGIDHYRQEHHGKVLFVSPDGQVAMIQQLPYNEIVEVERDELMMF